MPEVGDFGLAGTSTRGNEAALPRALIIIPAYNEEQSIGGVVGDLRRVVPDYDRLVVNDGSVDQTGEVLEKLGERQLRLPFNLGYGLALQTGMQYALARGYDLVVTLDADGQHQPSDIPRLIEVLLTSGADMVIGSRFCKAGQYGGPLMRRLGQELFSRLTHLLLRQRIFDTSSGFKVFRSTVCAALVGSSFMDFHIETLVRLRLLDYKIIEAPILVRERVHGQSMHSLASVFQYPVKTLILTVVAAMDVWLTRRPR
jgi:glycosyltransferase involved in cell wall biosynthesis